MSIDFSVTTNIYSKREALKDSYRPDEIVGRDDELENYKDSLLPVVQNEEPDNVFLYGKTGVGKTASTSYILSELKNACEQNGVNLNVIHVNCKTLNTSYKLGVELVNEFSSPDNQISARGHGEGVVYNRLFEAIERNGGTTLIVLDEIDSVKQQSLNKLLYRFSRARSAGGDLVEAKVGTICISSDLTLKERLDPDVRSTLAEQSIEFNPYDADELIDILEQRAKVAFQDGAIDSSIISAAAGHGAQEGGDARRSLDLLRGAGDEARRRNKDIITKEHLSIAREKLRKEQILNTIKELSEHEKITMYAIATLSTGEQKNPRSIEIYKRYTKLCGDRAVTSRSVREYLSDFDDLNITTSHSRYGGTKGNYLDHELNYNIKEVLEALSDIIEECGVHQSVSHYDVCQDVINK